MRGNQVVPMRCSMLSWGLAFGAGRDVGIAGGCCVPVKVGTATSTGVTAAATSAGTSGTIGGSTGMGGGTVLFDRRRRHHFYGSRFLALRYLLGNGFQPKLAFQRGDAVLHPPQRGSEGRPARAEVLAAHRRIALVR